MKLGFLGFTSDATNLDVWRVLILVIVLGTILAIGMIFLTPIFESYVATKETEERVSSIYEELKKEAVEISRAHFLEVTDKQIYQWSSNGGRWYYRFHLLMLKEGNQNRNTIRDWRLKISMDNRNEIERWANDCKVGDRVRFILSVPEFHAPSIYRLEHFLFPIPIPQKGGELSNEKNFGNN